jgi:hypothetical protein
MTVTPRLLLSFIQSSRVPVSKPEFCTSWEQVGCAVVVTVTVVVEIDTEVTVDADIDGEMVGQVLDPDWVCVIVEVTAEAGILVGLGQVLVLEPDCVIVVVTVEAAGHVLEYWDFEVELVVELVGEDLQSVTKPPILATTHPTDLEVDVDLLLGHVIPAPVMETVWVVVVVWMIVTSCVFVVVSVVVLSTVVVFVLVLKSVVVEVFGIVNFFILKTLNVEGGTHLPNCFSRRLNPFSSSNMSFCRTEEREI